MRFRLKAFGLHLSASVTVLTLIFGALYLGWYRWPGWYLTGVLHVAPIVAIVDLAIGPTLTLIVANPRKPRRALARDIAAIVIVQLAALIYGAATLWLRRPLSSTFSLGRLRRRTATKRPRSPGQRSSAVRMSFRCRATSDPGSRVCRSCASNSGRLMKCKPYQEPKSTRSGHVCRSWGLRPNSATHCCYGETSGACS